MSSKRVAEDDVIDLTLDSSDDEQDTGSNSNSNNNAKSSKRARAGSQAASASIDIENDDDDDEIVIIDQDEYNKKPAAKPSLKAPPKSSEDGIEVLDATVARPTTTAAVAAASSSNDDGELAVVGTRNEYKLPHLRQDCTTCKFTANPSNRDDLREQNEKHCDLCYCYGKKRLLLDSNTSPYELIFFFLYVLFQCVMPQSKNAK